jgi:hypothetical protein
VATVFLQTPWPDWLGDDPQSIFGERLAKYGFVVGGRTAVEERMKKLTAKKTPNNSLSHKLVVVIGAGFRCMAYRDARGTLRNFWNQKVLPLPVHFLDAEY